MPMRDPWRSYRQVAAKTASPGKLVLMLFDGAIRFLETARMGFDKDDPLEFNLTINNNIQKAQAIVSELSASLDLQQGGQFAQTMQSLYFYIDRRLDESNRHKEPSGLEDALKRLTELREAWAEMLQKPAFDARLDGPKTLGTGLAMAG
jgi:flagellar protein FliS